MKRQRLSSELTLSPFEELDKRYINGRIVNVTYHLTDWWKCFRSNISEGVFNDAIRGFCMAHPQHTTADAVYNLQRMSDKHIREYAEHYNAQMEHAQKILRAGTVGGLAALDFLDFMG
ncbi:MAG: hypothetical protein K2L88_05785 [Clostridiales bacterium]|nr:hypothetical protein [Clostridiales bacterium]